MPGGYGVWVAGWVYRGVLPSHPALLEETHTSEAGPGRPCRGLEWVGMGRTYWGRAGMLLVPPCGPGRPCWAPCTRTLLIPPLQPIGTRFHDISRKVSQNGQVSPKSCQKAYVSPCFQNGLKKSPLEIPGFPLSPAFSPKELMGLF